MQEDLEDNYNDYSGAEEENSLSKGRKIAVFFLGVFALLTIGMWMIQFKNSIKQPFAYKGTDSVGLANDEGNSEEALKGKDTDKDGISDWNEMNTYKTSPYLEDSDSDGFTDREEIANNNDPNCPSGRDCYAVGNLENNTAPDSNTNNSSLNSLLNQFGANANTTAGAGQADIGAILGSNLDATTLRQMLTEAGMDKKLLDQISDEDLMKSYQEVSRQ